ncbi:DNA processing protein DprA [Azospira sp. I13]|uniref:DNA-processing protein DprA n=1 Tax=Azospira sp. I13 TaxID=1765050 RepID=UPI000D4393BA|nr:DNA-processing protein DprA [Azospira sp. I13]GBG03208.1 DNA processing protein DprA [Azospira sp. I13]
MADRSLAAWLRLTLVPGIGPEGQRHLLAAFGPPEQIFAASRSELRGVVGKKADLLLDTDNQDAVARALAWASQPGNAILPLGDGNYPQLLLESADPPTLLYAKGRLELLNRPAVAIVGSRNATPQGIQDAEAFARSLAADGLTIVSGLALGIDGAAHRGAVDQPGSTIAVIGTGADRIYPSRHKELALQLATDGVIISEFPLGTPAVAHNFPRRNRIIAGLAAGCLVVEAAMESGSLITARLAGELGRDVFAIPGSIHSPVARGCHRLIKQGAKLVENARDIFEELGHLTLDLPGQPQPRSATTAAAQVTTGTASRLSRDEAKVIAALGHDPANMDQLLQRTGLTTEALCAILVALELADHVASLPGGRYQRLAAT